MNQKKQKKTVKNSKTPQINQENAKLKKSTHNQDSNTDSDFSLNLANVDTIMIDENYDMEHNDFHNLNILPETQFNDEKEIIVTANQNGNNEETNVWNDQVKIIENEDQEEYETSDVSEDDDDNDEDYNSENDEYSDDEEGDSFPVNEIQLANDQFDNNELKQTSEIYLCNSIF